MKTLKRIFALAMVVCAMFALTACGSTDIEGTWVLTEAKMTMQGTEMDMIEMGMSMTLEIKDDGTFEMTTTMPEIASSYNNTVTGEWTFKNGELTFSAGGTGGTTGFLGTDSLKLEKGKLVSSATEAGMTISIVFEKE